MLKWLPWRFIVKHVARANGFIDPMAVHAQLQKFSQPAEVAEPVELLRAGVVFHARGLLNSKVIQHNLDWVWPYWVERQCDPTDISFLPRAFSITQINLTHRNWTAIGVPGCDELPVVDPRGLLTPFWDSWSLDVWLLKENGDMLLPSRQAGCLQTLNRMDGHVVETVFNDNDMQLTLQASVQMTAEGPACVLKSTGLSSSEGWLVVSARPCNAEGISLIDDLELSADRTEWTINKQHTVRFDQPVQRHHACSYQDGDVHIHLTEKDDVHKQHCSVGVVTAAAMYPIKPGVERTVSASVPLTRGMKKESLPTDPDSTSEQLWMQALSSQTRLQVADSKLSMLYENSVRGLVLCTPGEVYAGPYTYKRYWYRDAVFIAYGLLRAGLNSRVKSIVNQFPQRQRANGYFHSQEGEWDSNGQVLWMIHQYHCSTGVPLGDRLWQSVKLGAEWIINKRLTTDTEELWAGLLPAGFSAEHLGPNDYYYWDDYWAIAGLESAAKLARSMEMSGYAKRYQDEADSLAESVASSLQRWSDNNQSAVAIPASPLRRMDAGAIGSIATGYPLRLCEPDDERLTGTAEYLMQECFCQGGFFQDMIHSGINIYLTLQIAQTLLRKNDMRFYDLMKSCSDLASSTGTWPEAVHPNTHGGCMGDGHHAWAAAEWVSLVRNCFVREEAGSLIIGSGVMSDWLEPSTETKFGPSPTEFGTVIVSLTPAAATGGGCLVEVEGDWHEAAPDIVIRVPGFVEVPLAPGETSIELTAKSTSGL